MLDVEELLAPRLESEAEFWVWLKDRDGGCCVATEDLGDGLYAGVKPLMFHFSLILGAVGNTGSYEDHYCFPTRELAERALSLWDGRGDPVGWHRHPRTGRRRPGGDPAKEYLAP